jgi:hypothetical protein
MARAELPELLRGHRLALGQFLVGAIGNYELEALSAGVPVVMRFDREAALDDLAARGPAWVDANHAAHTVATRVLDDYRRTGQTPS